MSTKNKNRPKFLDDVTYLPTEEYEFGVVADKPGKPKNQQFGQRVYAARHPRLTPEQWQEYWGNQGAGYINNARDKIAPYFMAGAGLAAAPALLPYASTIITNPYVDAVLTTHGALIAPKNIKSGVSNFRKGNYASGAVDFGSVGLDLLGAGLLANKIVKPAARLFNSSLTGNWTRIGNREYRLSPNSLGSGSIPLESRKITQRINVTPENAALISPERWTAAQDAAIAKGDIAEAQRLRDLHFITHASNTKAVDAAGYPLPLYHGTGTKFNYFDDNKIGSNYLDLGFYGRGHYFTPQKEAAEGYASVYNTPMIYKVYGNFKNPKLVNLDDESMIGQYIKNNDSVIAGLDNLDYSEYVAKSGSQVKSADAVTYDDNGIRIPLGLRDNFKLNDIRYGIIPLLGIGAASNFTNSRSSKFH